MYIVEHSVLVPQYTIAGDIAW